MTVSAVSSLLRVYLHIRAMWLRKMVFTSRKSTTDRQSHFFWRHRSLVFSEDALRTSRGIWYCKPLEHGEQNYSEIHERETLIFFHASNNVHYQWIKATLWKWYSVILLNNTNSMQQSKYGLQCLETSVSKKRFLDFEFSTIRFRDDWRRKLSIKCWTTLGFLGLEYQTLKFL